MNYRHAFHAGGFADVIKHIVLVRILSHLQEKPAAFRVIDTHAGAGLYDLTGEEAHRSGEWLTGIARLMQARLSEKTQPLVGPYLDIIRAFNPQAALAAYPGSPLIARAMLRPQDRLTACEIETGARKRLVDALRRDTQARVVDLDGWTALPAFVPPNERRGLVLIDPPFEMPDEYEHLLRALRQGVRRFATGCYAVWYPIKDDAAAAFAADLAAFKPLVLELRLDGVAPGKLAACGLAVINPPWRFEEAMREALPWIAAQLGSGVSWAVDAAPATPAAPASSG